MKNQPEEAPDTIYIAQPVPGSWLKQWFRGITKAQEWGEPIEYRRVSECEWVYDGDYYDTKCGTGFYFTDGSAEDNKAYYCHNCGGRIKVVNDE